MEDSDEEGFQEAKVQLTTVKLKNNFACTNSRHLRPEALLNRSPISLHHQLKLYQYSQELDIFQVPILDDSPSFYNEELIKEFMKDEYCPPLLLSQYFPRKFTCIYNKFHQNLQFKRDLTIIIRNVTRRIRNDQLVTFQEIPIPLISQTALSFCSDFEGGNLLCVYKCKKTSIYFLLLQNDVNTHGYNIWFHFNIYANKGGNYKFLIVNLSRPIKCQEQRLLSFSSLSNTYERKISVNCFQSKFRHCQVEKNFYSLYFQYDFKEGQSVYLSPIPPYTYSKAIRFIKSKDQISTSKISVTLQIAGKSEIGNLIPCLKISKKQKPSRKVILVTARQHPCQTVGSFVCEELIKLLISQSDLAMQLLDQYSLYVIPMINPDGVIHGNSRTNLLGYDINRSWDPVINYKSQQCTQIWEYLLKIGENSEQEIYWTFDLHGHSKQLGYFAYFSEQNEDSLILNQILKDKSELYDTKRCSFAVGSSKRQSLRGKFYERLGITNSVTIQTSFYGFMNKSDQFQHFASAHFKQIAGQIIESLVETHKILRNRALKKEILQEIIQNRKNKKSQIQIRQTNINFDSDSNPQESYLKSQERNQQIIDYRTIQAIRTKTQIDNTRRTGINFVSKNRRSSTIQDHKNLREINVESSPDFKTNLQNQTSVQKNISYEKSYRQKNMFQSPYRFLQRDNKPLRIRRKIFSQQKYVNSGLMKEPRTQRESSLENIQQGLELIQSKRHNFEQARKITILGFKTRKNQNTKTNHLQTIIYPTSNEVAFELTNKTKILKQKIKALRQKQYGTKTERNMFSQIFKYHQK